MSESEILIVGCKGMLGGQFSLKYPNAIQIDMHNCDVTDYKNLMKITENISLIINCVAFTNVDLCQDEEKQDLVYNSNVISVHNLICFANYKKAKLIHFSTDYVFDGLSNIPYVESDVRNPIQFYGKTKLIAEDCVERFCHNYLIVRISWLFGVNGSNFIWFVLNSLSQNKEVSLLNNYYGTPTSTKTIVDNLPLNENGIIHFTNNYKENHMYGINEDLSWYLYGKKLAEIAGFDPELIKPIVHIERPAKRPQYSILNIDKLLNIKNIEHWYIPISQNIKNMILYKNNIR